MIIVTNIVDALVEEMSGLFRIAKGDRGPRVVQNEDGRKFEVSKVILKGDSGWSIKQIRH